MGRWTTRLAAALGVLFAVALVALGGVGGYLYWNRVEIRAEQQASVELPPLAAQQIPLVLGFDYQTVERSRTEVVQPADARVPASVRGRHHQERHPAGAGPAGGQPGERGRHGNA